MHSKFTVGVRSLSMASLLLAAVAACGAGEGAPDPGDPASDELSAALDELGDELAANQDADLASVDAGEAPGCAAPELAGSRPRASTCAGEAFVRRDRKGKVLKAWLECAGECPTDDQDCEERMRTNHHDEQRAWCGCDPKEEPTTCHVTIHTSAAGDKRALCAGSCLTGTCTPKETPVANEENGVKLVSIKCSCQ